MGAHDWAAHKGAFADHVTALDANINSSYASKAALIIHCLVAQCLSSTRRKL